MEVTHVEYLYTLQTSDTVIVFVHGIQGSPLQFDYFIQRLKGSYSIESLLLPGHGKTAKDFKKSNMAQWQSYVDERIKLLQETYKNIILVGHSMGCLLSVQSAILYPEKVRGLFLFAMPLRIHISFPYIKNNLVIAFSRKENSEIIAAARKVNSVTVSHPLEYLAAMPRYIELLNKCRSTRELIKALQLPIVVVQSENDEIVSNKSLYYVKEKPNIQIIIVKHASHYYYSHETQQEISNTLQQFVSEVINE